MNHLSYLRISFFGLLLCLFSCKGENIEQPNPVPPVSETIEVTLNPNGIAPLTAILTINNEASVSIRLKVIGQHGTPSDLIRDFMNVPANFQMPVVGLYPNFKNQIELDFMDSNGNSLKTETIEIQTTNLLADLPAIIIDKKEAAAMTVGWNLVNYFGHNGEIFPQRPFMFDEFGDIRWYLDFKNHPQLGNLFFDNGLNRLKNGNFIFGNVNNGLLYEIDLLGKLVNNWPLNGYNFHHTVIEKPNGNFLVTVTRQGKATKEDEIIEIDRSSKAIIRRWDLTAALDKHRKTWDSDITDIQLDWFHGNSLQYDASDNTIIISGRTQGIVKLTASNEVVWILAPHKGWNSAGNGTDLTTLLLQPLDKDNSPIMEQTVLDGDVNHADFEWPWYQHAPQLMPNGQLLVFDNGENRNFSSNDIYSRAVIYEIAETEKTIKQVWAYGKELGEAAYSRIVSSVSYYEATDNILFTPGAVKYNNQNYGKVIEVNQANQQVVFEATLTPPQANFNITFHNVQRMPIILE